ncbi:MAG: hypothetical protein ACOYW3_02735, partial [Bacteroidota bacterium]
FDSLVAFSSQTNPEERTLAMKTSSYNPSPLEVDFANALIILQGEIQKHLQDNQVIHVESNIKRDNPMVKFNLLDKDGDPHEIVVRIIQIPDKF